MGRASLRRVANSVVFDAPPWQVVVEDDGRVVYAYLLREQEIVADVWLSNRAVPSKPEWLEPNASERMPFLNPLPFVDPKSRGVTGLAVEDLRTRWREGGLVELCLGEVTVATLAPGERPGRCVYADMDGPLAVCLSRAAPRPPGA
jgi:hypothetical protein